MAVYRAPRSVPEMIGLGALGDLAFVATVVGVALVLQGIRSGLRKPPETDGETPGWLEELRLYTSAYATPRSKTVRQLVIGVVLIIPVVVLGIFRPALCQCGPRRPGREHRHRRRVVKLDPCLHRPAPLPRIRLRAGHHTTAAQPS